MSIRQPVRPLDINKIIEAYPLELLVDFSTGNFTVVKQDGSTISHKKPGTLTIKQGDTVLIDKGQLYDALEVNIPTNSPTATKLATAVKIGITGGATGTAQSFDGSAGISIPVTALDASKLSSGTMPVDRLPTSGVTAGNYGPSANASPAHKGTFSIPYITVDTYGRVTAASTKTITLPSDNDTHWTTHLYVGPTGTAAKGATTNGNTYLKLYDESTARESYKISGSGATTVTSDANGNITISSTNTTYSAGTGLSLSGTTFNHSNSIKAGTAQGTATSTLAFGGSFTIPTITYDAQGHITQKGSTTITLPSAPTTITGNAGTATKLAKSVNIGLSGVTATAQSFDGSSSINIPISAIPSSLLTGTIDLARLPKAALERLVIVADATARLALTTDQIQNGDVVKETSTGFLYFVVDETKLGTNDAFTTFKAGTAAAVDWSGVTNKPTIYQPSDSTPNSVGSTASAAGTSNTFSRADHRHQLATSGVTAGNYGPSANASPAHKGTFSVPYITVDAYGRVTAASTKTITLPSDSNTHWTSKNIVGGSATATANTSTALTNGNVYLNHIENGTTVTSTHNIKGSGATTVTTDANGNIIISSTDNNTDTHYTTGLYVGANNTTAANAATTNTNTYLKLFDNSTRRAIFNIKGSGATTVTSDANGNITISSTDNNTVYTHPSHTAHSSGLYKITVNNLGHVTAATAVTKADITGLGIPGSDTNTHYTTGLYIGASGAKSNAATSNGSTYLKLYDDSTSRASFLIKGSGATTVASDASGNITISSTDTNTHYTTGLYIGASGAKSNAATTNGNTYLKLYDDSTSRASFKITGSGATTVTSDASGNITISSTDNNTKNTAGSTDTSSKIYLIGATSQAANPQTYSDNEVYATSGVLTTKKVQVGGTAATIEYDSTNKCINFVFA